MSADSSEPIRRVRAALGHAVRLTPLLPSPVLSDRLGVPVLLKAEHMQVTGSFKARGALYRLQTMGDEERRRGVVTVSAGNHAAAVAWAAATVGVQATVVMPRTAPRAKVEACRSYGATLILEDDVFRALDRCLALRDEQGLTLVHPFDDPEILDGTGTVAVEILDACPEVRSVVVPVGGGGLIAGMARTLVEAAPDVVVVGVEPDGADAMSRSLAEGRPVRLETVRTVADGLGAPMAGDLTYPIVQDHVRSVVRVPDSVILEGLRHLIEIERQVVEPAGAAGVGALLAGRFDLEGPVVVVVSGGNVDLDAVAGLLSHGET